MIFSFLNLVVRMRSKNIGDIVLQSDEFRPNFAVLISIYFNDDPALLDMALSSIFNNTLQPSSVVLVYDGPVSAELNFVARHYLIHENLFIHQKQENEGLAKALNFGVKFCNTEWIVRADADDYNLPHRFAKLSRFMGKEFDLFGSFIEEIDLDGRITGLRAPPTSHKNIVKFSKYRNPFNHMSVCFRKSTFLAAGGYPDLYLREDYGLWATMISLGAQCHNIEDPLVRATAGKAMYMRRGGFRYALGEIALQIHLVRCGIKSPFSAFVHGLARGSIFLVSNSIRAIFYEKFLRNRLSNFSK
jgi:glycosyltransferase involved in cell wall biosynthesis